MNQKKIIILSGVVLIALITAGFIVQYILSHHTVTFNFKRDNLKISIRQQLDNNKYSNTGSLSQSGSLSLVNGDYIIDIESTNPQKPISKEIVKFSVHNTNATIDINPRLSDAYLNNILENNRKVIHEIIKSKYSLAGYELSKERVIGDGDWYAAIFTQGSVNRENGDEYFIVAKRSGDTWSIVTAPRLVVTSHEYPDIPQDILDQVNRLYYN